jgi:membrane fusion protein, multidrug efflux system
MSDGQRDEEARMEPTTTTDPEVAVPAPEAASPPAPMPARRSWSVPVGIGVGVLAVLLGGGLMLRRAAASRNQPPLAAQAKGVTTTRAQAGTYRQERRYVGTVEPWVEAQIGPQYTSAYVNTVLVRPGQAVKRGAVVATLDCRNASAQSKAIAMQAQALQTTQAALANEATRVRGLLKGGYVSPNEAEIKTAASQSKQAELLSAQARLLRVSLEVSDCVLRAPFDGEVADRLVDPGAFVRPGVSMIRLVDRNIVRIVAEVPENDFEVVAPGRAAKIRLLANSHEIQARIARRSPAADSSTRTVHLEIDVPDPARAIPVGSTATVMVSVGEPAAATVVPLSAAVVRGQRASLFVVEQGVARKRHVAVLGESEGTLYLEPKLAAAAEVVVQGREALLDGDRVAAQPASGPAAEPGP